jgi:hypothetical protein
MRVARATLAGTEGRRDGTVVIWKPNQSFTKIGQEGRFLARETVLSLCYDTQRKNRKRLILFLASLNALA